MFASRVSHSSTEPARRGSAPRSSSRVSSMTTMRVSAGSTFVIARSSVVLPAPVSPDTTTRMPARIAAASSERMARSIVPALLELVERGVGEHVAADRDLRHRRDVHDRGEPRPVGEAQHEQRLGVVEAALGAAGPPGEVGDLVAQVVGVGEDRLADSARRPSTCCTQIVSWALTMMSVTPSRSRRPGTCRRGSRRRWPAG